MLDRDPVAPVLRRIDAADVPAFVDAMASREVRVLAGLDAAGPPPRPTLRLEVLATRRPGVSQTWRFG